MKPSIRTTPEGIELYDGDNREFRAWPLTAAEAYELAADLLNALTKRREEKQKGGA